MYVFSLRYKIPERPLKELPNSHILVPYQIRTHYEVSKLL